MQVSGNVQMDALKVAEKFSTSTTFISQNNLNESGLGKGWPKFYYEGHTPIIVDGRLFYDGSTNKGHVYFIKQNAFMVGRKDIANAAAYEKRELEGAGAGIESFIIRDMHLFHPVGFDFIGVLDESKTDFSPTTKNGRGTYRKLAGGKFSELAGGYMYKPVGPIEQSRILILNVNTAV